MKVHDLSRYWADTVAKQERLQRQVLASAMSARDVALASQSAVTMAREAMRAHQQGLDSIRAAFENQSAIAIAQAAVGFNAMARVAIDRASVRTDEAFGASVRDMAITQENLRRSMLTPIIAAMRAQQVERSILDMKGMTAVASNLFGIARTKSRLRKTDFDLNRTVASALEEVEHSGEVVEQQLLPGSEEDRQTLTIEMGKRVIGYESLPAPGKVVHLIEFITTNPSSNVSAAAFGIAMGQLSSILGEPDLEKVFSKMLYLMFFIAMSAIARLGKKKPGPAMRQVLRSIPIDRDSARLVTRTCIVSNQPKSKCMKVGWLSTGMLVTVVDRMKGWRQIIFVDSAGNDRAGWVRSKNLMRL